MKSLRPSAIPGSKGGGSCSASIFFAKRLATGRGLQRALFLPLLQRVAVSEPARPEGVLEVGLGVGGAEMVEAGLVGEELFHRLAVGAHIQAPEELVHG